MHVTCTCCYRNEADIIEAFVRHTVAYCDELLLLDHGSTDESPQIVQALLREGLPLHLFSDATLGNVETDQSNRLLRLAAEEFQADWVLSLDADEFLCGASDNSFLPAAVEDDEMPCLKIRSRSYYAHPADREELLNPVERITHRLAAEEMSDAKVFVPGWLIRREPGFLGQGKHQYFLEALEAPALFLQGVALAHFSLRSPAQYAIKLASRQLQKGRRISALGDDLPYYNKPFALLKESYSDFEKDFAAQRLAYKTPPPDEKLLHDPIAYRGAELCYTLGKSHGADRFIREVLELAEELARSTQPLWFEGSAHDENALRKLNLELTSGPSPGHAETLHTAVDRTRFRSFILPADCPPDASELHLSLRADPGLLEISEIILNYPGARRGETYGVEDLQKMIRVASGGALIAPTGVLRILLSKDPVRLIISGWRKRGPELPDELLLRARLEHHLVSESLLSTTVLNTIAAEQWELTTCRNRLAAAERTVAVYKDYLANKAYDMGSVINFATNGNSLFYLGEGWSFAEEWGTWSDGNRAVLHIRFAEPPRRPLRLEARLMAFHHAEHPEMHVCVRLRGAELALWKLSSPDVETFQVVIPADNLRECDCEVVFEILDPASPEELGIGGDPRRLGIGMHSVAFHWAKAAAEETPALEAGNAS